MKVDPIQFLIVLAIAIASTGAAVYAPSPIREAAAGLAVLCVGAMGSFLKGPPSPPALMVFGLCFVMWGCHATPQQVDSGVDVAQGIAGTVCSELVATLDNAAVNGICATESEVSQIIDIVQRLQGPAKPGAATKCLYDAAKRALTCGSQEDLHMAIDVIVERRMGAARRDAGK